MLVPAVMREALRTFGDRIDADFEAFPGGESNARLDAIAIAFHAATNLITTGGGAVAYS
jgi:hypothetical protein